MRSIPVDTSVLEFVVAGQIEPATALDGSPRVDRAGRALWNVPVVVFPREGQGEGLTVRVPGVKENLPRMTSVAFDRLVANAWTIDGRSGVSFRAEAVARRQVKP